MTVFTIVPTMMAVIFASSNVAASLYIGHWSKPLQVTSQEILPSLATLSESISPIIGSHILVARQTQCSPLFLPRRWLEVAPYDIMIIANRYSEITPTATTFLHLKVDRGLGRGRPVQLNQEQIQSILEHSPPLHFVEPEVSFVRKKSAAHPPSETKASAATILRPMYWDTYRHRVEGVFVKAFPSRVVALEGDVKNLAWVECVQSEVHRLRQRLQKRLGPHLVTINIKGSEFRFVSRTSIRNEPEVGLRFAAKLHFQVEIFSHKPWSRRAQLVESVSVVGEGLQPDLQLPELQRLLAEGGSLPRDARVDFIRTQKTNPWKTLWKVVRE